MIVLIDNYDSFSYNLFQLIGGFDEDIKVIRNDEFSIDEIAALKPNKIILSPGPGKPSEAGILEDVVKDLGENIPILGVCLGHQAICEAFGGTITYAKNRMHGKQSMVSLDTNSALFQSMKKTILVARYHSLAVDPTTIPDSLKVTAYTKENEIMAVEHKQFPIYGVQFHPESILTPDGITMIKNFINL